MPKFVSPLFRDNANLIRRRRQAGMAVKTHAGPSKDDGQITVLFTSDTQSLALSSPTNFNGLTTWVANNYSSLGADLFVLSGDITDEGSAGEWSTAMTAIGLLPSGLPTHFCSGNHDGSLYDSNITQAFYTGKSWWGSGGFYDSTAQSHYRLFTVDGRDYMIISLRGFPSAAEVTWAANLCATYEARRVIVMTHALINMLADGSLNTDYAGGDSITGEYIFNNLIKIYPNIIATFSGHHLGTGTYRQQYTEKTGDNGNVIPMFIINLQVTGGGYARVQVLDFDFGARTLRVRTYDTVAGVWVSSATWGPYDYTLTITRAGS
jgi:hypothetical protein